MWVPDVTRLCRLEAMGAEELMQFSPKAVARLTALAISTNNEATVERFLVEEYVPRFFVAVAVEKPLVVEQLYDAVGRYVFRGLQPSGVYKYSWVFASIFINMLPTCRCVQAVQHVLILLGVVMHVLQRAQGVLPGHQGHTSAVCECAHPQDVVAFTHPHNQGANLKSCLANLFS
jgi:hypothetical protein